MGVEQQLDRHTKMNKESHLNLSTRALIVAFAGLALFALVLVTRREEYRAPGQPQRVLSRLVSEYHWQIAPVAKDEYLGDVERITREIHLLPTMSAKENTVTFLRIVHLSEKSPMFSAGFRVDDRILKLNARPIGSLERAINLIHEIKACNHLTVQVQRGDKIIDYQFDFE